MCRSIMWPGVDAIAHEREDPKADRGRHEHPMQRPCWKRTAAPPVYSDANGMSMPRAVEWVLLAFG